MTNENKKYAGIAVSVSRPFIDKETKKKSITIRYFLEKKNSDELCFCDIQFPQEIVINKHHMSDVEVEAMMIHYDHFSKEMWDIAEGLPELNDTDDGVIEDMQD